LFVLDCSLQAASAGIFVLWRAHNFNPRLLERYQPKKQKRKKANKRTNEHPKMISTTNTSFTAPLADNFSPSVRDVVIGKGKKFYYHAGNQWLRDVVAVRIEEYSAAVTKAEKSAVISSVVDCICHEGRFVKIDPKDGSWVYAEPLLCREKCSQTFRDNLAQRYRSSNVAKRNKRRQKQLGKTIHVLDAASTFVAFASMPPAKRMRVEAEPTVMSSMPALTGSEDPAFWFDWEMPVRDLESTKPARRLSISFDLFPETEDGDIFDPFQIDSSPFFSETSVLPVKHFSTSSSIVYDGAFQRRTAVAFAA
jgi:hypothetical protein